jgi:hypothetical protein
MPRGCVQCEGKEFIGLILEEVTYSELQSLSLFGLRCAKPAFPRLGTGIRIIHSSSMAPFKALQH